MLNEECFHKRHTTMSLIYTFFGIGGKTVEETIDIKTVLRMRGSKRSHTRFLLLFFRQGSGTAVADGQTTLGVPETST